MTFEPLVFTKVTPAILPLMDPTAPPGAKMAMRSGCYLVCGARGSSASFGGLRTDLAEAFLAFLQGAETVNRLGRENKIGGCRNWEASNHKWTDGGLGESAI